MITDSDIERQIPLVAEAGTQRTRSCPDPSLLAAYADARLRTEECTELEDHLADCTFCLGQVGFLVRNAYQESPAVPSHLLDSARTGRARWIDWLSSPAPVSLAVAATLILAVAVVVQFAKVPISGVSSPWGSDSTTETGAPRLLERTSRNGSAATSVPRIVEPAEGAVLAGPEIEVLWQETPRALQYIVLVVSLQGDVIWESRTTDSRAVVPAAGLSAGDRYFVWIEAQLRGGGTLKSAPVGFRLAPD